MYGTQQCTVMPFCLNAVIRMLRRCRTGLFADAFWTSAVRNAIRFVAVKRINADRNSPISADAWDVASVHTHKELGSSTAGRWVVRNTVDRRCVLFYTVWSWKGPGASGELHLNARACLTPSPSPLSGSTNCALQGFLASVTSRSWPVESTSMAAGSLAVICKSIPCRFHQA